MGRRGELDSIDGQLAEFRLAQEAEDWSPAAVSSYVGNVRQFAEWYAETYQQSFRAESIVQREVQEHRTWMLAKSAAPETINRRLVSIRKFFDWLGVTNNPAAKVKGITIVDPGVQALSSVQLRRLLREVYAHQVSRDIAILEVLCNTGIRVGELAGLRLGDVDIQERRGAIKIRSGKGRTSREVPMNLDARRAVSAWLEVRPDDRGDFLFLGQRGEQLSTSGIWRIVRRYGDYAGIEDLRVHQLRHTVLTRLVRERGVDLATVARISGHSSIKTLLRYAAPTQDDMERAMEGLVLGGE